MRYWVNQLGNQRLMKTLSRNRVYPYNIFEIEKQKSGKLSGIYYVAKVLYFDFKDEVITETTQSKDEKTCIQYIFNEVQGCTKGFKQGELFLKVETPMSQGEEEVFTYRAKYDDQRDLIVELFLLVIDRYKKKQVQNHS